MIPMYEILSPNPTSHPTVLNHQVEIQFPMSNPNPHPPSFLSIFGKDSLRLVSYRHTQIILRSTYVRSPKLV